MVGQLGVGMVGYGFIGKVHTLCYQSIPLYYDPSPVKVKLVGVSTAHKESGHKAIEQAGYEFATTDYRVLLEREDINIINCCTPNYLHKDILIDAVRAGKHVYCEKPLAMNLREAKEILEVIRGSQVKHQMVFQYRFVPAMMRAKQLVDAGFLGKIFHFRASYLHSGYIDPLRPISWRLDKKKSGGGALFDLGSHALDTVRFLLGDFESVYATTQTFFKKRPLEGALDKKGEVEVDDLALLQLKLERGGVGALEVSRVATGTNDEMRVEIHGSKGALSFNLMEPNWLYVYDVRENGEPIGGMRGFKRMETVQRYPKPAVLPGPKFSVGWMRYHIASLYNFLKHIAAETMPSPNFEDGLKIQEIMEATYLSVERKEWVKLPL